MCEREWVFLRKKKEEEGEKREGPNRRVLFALFIRPTSIAVFIIGDTRSRQPWLHIVILVNPPEMTGLGTAPECSRWSAIRRRGREKVREREKQRVTIFVVIFPVLFEELVDRDFGSNTHRYSYNCSLTMREIERHSFKIRLHSWRKKI